MQGPNVRKLIAHRMSTLAIPPNGGLEDGIRFLQSEDRIVQAAKDATAWVKEAISVVKTAPDNPYETDEKIAGEILKKIEEQRSKRWQ